MNIEYLCKYQSSKLKAVQYISWILLRHEYDQNISEIYFLNYMFFKFIWLLWFTIPTILKIWYDTHYILFLMFPVSKRYHMLKSY